jgi:hypothetical protein
MRLLIKHIVSWIDIADTTFIIGLLLVAYGLWRVYEPLAYIGSGSLLVGLVLVPRFQRRKDK